MSIVNTFRRGGMVALLLLTAASVILVRPAVPAQANASRPLFQLPFPCGETWRLSTYRGHDDYDIDMIATSGTTNGRPIVASEGGTVVSAGWSNGGGWGVRIAHGSGWATLYLHMIEAPMVGVNQVVARGQQIGRVGSTGDSSGPHLHYEQLLNGGKTESWFNGVPSGITSDGDPNTGPLYISGPVSPSINVVSNNCEAARLTPPVAPVVYNGEFHVVGTTSRGNVVDRWYSGTNWYTNDLGGIIQGSPSAAVYNGQFHVVGASAGTVYHKWFSGSAWYDWRPLSSGADPVAVVYNGQFHVLSRAANGNVLDAYYDGTTWRTQNLGGIIQGAPAAAVYNGQFHVVGANAGTVFHKWFSGSAWYDWLPIKSGYDPAAAVYSHNGVNELHVLSRQNNGSLTDAWYNGGWHHQDLGGIIQGAPSVKVYNGQFHILAANAGTVYHKWYSGTTWVDWGVRSSGSNPVAAVYSHNGVNEFHVLSRQSNGTVSDAWYNGATWYTQTIHDLT